MSMRKDQEYIERKMMKMEFRERGKEQDQRKDF